MSSRPHKPRSEIYVVGIWPIGYHHFVAMEIMSAPISWSARVWTLSCSLFLSQAAGLLAAELVLQKVPPVTIEQSASYPRDVARYCLVAQVEAVPQSNPIAGLQLSSKSEHHNVTEAALLCGDPTAGYPLSNGTTTLLVSLSKIENFDSISFRNSGAKGDVLIATANAKLPADSPQWNKVIQQDLTPDVVKIKIGPSEAKYVKLTFRVIETGRIAGLGIYSIPAVSDGTTPRSRKMVQDKSESLALISYNLSNVHSRARALYVSSGEDLKQADNMIDEQPGTSYRFDTSDTTPAAIIDLGEVTKLRRISTIYSPAKSRVDFYVLQTLAGEATSTAENVPKTLRVSEKILAEVKPIGSVVDDGTGRAAIDFPVTRGRYVMLKWSPAMQQDTAFSVAEIAAFGSNETQSTNLTLANTSLAGAGGGVISDAKDVVMDVKDFKECCAEEAEPPGEGPPSPFPEPPSFVSIPFVSP